MRSRAFAIAGCHGDDCYCLISYHLPNPKSFWRKSTRRCQSPLRLPCLALTDSSYYRADGDVRAMVLCMHQQSDIVASMGQITGWEEGNAIEKKNYEYTSIKRRTLLPARWVRLRLTLRSRGFSKISCSLFAYKNKVKATRRPMHLPHDDTHLDKAAFCS
ncbi:hypothetical protein BCR43DRAFT_189400 [Syncephalastrum racemosum]|uniref:Uncharacterized protein n=1 Tax=Syncephalastrum racemosum TaxID=13706 RepID=A0A1X2HQQ0_SYNRA|nr:hypothetical protein BCR43DRAFT_189400 [Syncephalastrum racemosum]